MLKFITKLDYLLRETALGLQRGGWMNWAAVSTVTVLLFLFGLTLQASWQFERLLNQFGSQLEISVYLDPSINGSEVEPAVTALPDVTGVTLVSREEAWTALLEAMGLSDITGATQQLSGNPLVDELKVKAASSEAVPGLADKIAAVDGVDAVQYVDEAVRRISELNDGLSLISIVTIALLTVTAIAVITTTIRLIVMARRQEIEVMQLVGATATWIYFPFILQGIAFGCAGALLAWGGLMGIKQSVQQILVRQPTFVQYLTQDGPSHHPLVLPLILLGLGTSVGLMGSLFAVRRHALR
ncbi:MAG: ABC transporter permease [Cyanobacteria bacterium P01_A01_bin.135]